jgi:hypothetical protein
MSDLLRTKQREVIPQQNLYYARIGGDDSNDGKSVEYAKATAQALATAAINNDPAPSGNNRVSAEIIDGGDYGKFSLTAGGFVSIIAPYSTFGVSTTSSSPNGIVIADGYAAQLGFVRHKLEGSGDQAGVLVKCGAGPNATHVDIRQIFNSTVYDDVLFQSAGDTVFAEIEDLRQGTSRDSAAIFVESGSLFLRGNHRALGKIIVANGAKAYINSMYFDGDISVLGPSGFLSISGEYWNGVDLTNPTTGGTSIINFNTHVIPT